MNGILPLRLEGVSFAAGGRTIIAPLDLTLEAGASTVILGANGAGKSVLMRLMHGLLAPSAGRVAWSTVARSEASPACCRSFTAELGCESRICAPYSPT